MFHYEWNPSYETGKVYFLVGPRASLSCRIESSRLFVVYMTQPRSIPSLTDDLAYIQGSASTPPLTNTYVSAEKRASIF